MIKTIKDKTKKDFDSGEFTRQEIEIRMCLRFICMALKDATTRVPIIHNRSL